MHQTLQALTELQVWWVVKFQVLEGWHKMAGVPTVAMIPALGRIFEGLMWDITEKQSDEIDSDISVEPIEDPQRAYLIDFNQDKPAKLSVTIIVSANPCGTYSNIVTDALGRVGNVANLARLTVCYKLLVDLKRKQTTTPDALINVYTGHYFYRNMAITHISTSRDSNNPNVLIIDLDLIEFRFAKTPEIPNAKTPLDASKSSVNSLNQSVTSTFDRFVLEATKQLNDPQFISYAGQAVGFIRGALGV